MAKSYEQYCPIAHALDMVGDRWALLVVREVMRGPKRYTDLVDRLPGIGTNILATRLRDLERNGVLSRRTLPPPAASRVYELTDHGRRLRPVMRALSEWGALTLGPPAGDESGFFFGWLGNALDSMVAVSAPAGKFEFRVDGETASLVDGETLDGSVDDADVVVTGTATDVYSLLVTGRRGSVEFDGDEALLELLLGGVEMRGTSVLAEAT